MFLGLTFDPDIVFFDHFLLLVQDRGFDRDRTDIDTQKVFHKV